MRFSILLPVYNIEKYIRQTIDSLLAQRFEDYEVVVVDDGSRDSTPQILQSYGNRIRLLRQPNGGAESARNHAASVAQGEYLVMMDHDDVLLPCALSVYDRIARAFDLPPLIIGAMTYFNETPPATPADCPSVTVLKYRDYLSKEVPVGLTNSRIVIRKSVFDEIGGYGNQGQPAFPADDFNLVLKTGTYEPCVVVQEPFTVAYHVHDSNFIRNLDAVADGVLGLVRMERQGLYPGGRRRRWARYTVIGGIASTWAMKHCWRGKRKRTAVRLLWGAAPMVSAAVGKKLLTGVRKRVRPIVLPLAPVAAELSLPNAPRE